MRKHKPHCPNFIFFSFNINISHKSGCMVIYLIRGRIVGFCVRHMWQDVSDTSSSAPIILSTDPLQFYTPASPLFNMRAIIRTYKITKPLNNTKTWRDIKEVSYRYNFKYPYAKVNYMRLKCMLDKKDKTQNEESTLRSLAIVFRFRFIKL